MELAPEEYRGTDVSYSQICDRRLWLSLHNIYVLDGTEFVREGKYLSEEIDRSGFNSLRIGSNVIDNVEFGKDGQVKVHEYKRGKKALMADLLQLSHYLLCINGALGTDATGVLHLLGSRKTLIVKLDEYKERLIQAYEKIDVLRRSDIPKPVKNNFCRNGCSFIEFCWGGR